MRTNKTRQLSRGRLVGEGRGSGGLEEEKENFTVNEMRMELSGKLFTESMKENIKNKEEQLLLKIAKELTCREEAVTKSRQEYLRLEQSAETVKDRNREFAIENKRLRQSLVELDQEFVAFRKSQQAEIETREKQSQQREECTKDDVRKAEYQILRLKESLDLEDKQKTLTARRHQLQLQQTQFQLKTIIDQKQKQITKLQQSLQLITKQTELITAERLKDSAQNKIKREHLELQIKELNQTILIANEQLRLSEDKCSSLEQNMFIFSQKADELEVAYQQNVDKVSDEAEHMRKQYEYELQLQQQAIERANRSLQIMQVQFQLKQNRQGDITQRLQGLRVELGQRFKKLNNATEIVRLNEQIEKYRNIQVQLRNKVNLLQQEIDFLRSSSTKNQNLASIIKDHLSKHQNVQAQQRIALKVQKNHQDKLSQFRLPHGQSERQLNISRSRKALHAIDCNIQAKLCEGDGVYQVVKEELTSRKKSLVYLMFNEKAPSQQVEEGRPVMRPNRNKMMQRKRSCSLGQMVRLRCQRQVQ